jgi:hypothetical protein
MQQEGRQLCLLLGGQAGRYAHQFSHAHVPKLPLEGCSCNPFLFPFRFSFGRMFNLEKLWLGRGRTIRRPR